MKNIVIVLILFNLSAQHSYAAEDMPFSHPKVKVPPLALGSHQRKRSNSEPPRSAAPQHIVISPRKKVTSPRAQKHEQTDRAKGKKAALSDFIGSIAHEDKDGLFRCCDAIQAKLKDLKRQKEGYEWHISDVDKELELLEERRQKEYLPLYYAFHVLSNEQKAHMKKAYDTIMALAGDEIRRKQQFIGYLKPVLQTIQESEQKLAQIQLLLGKYSDNEEKAA